MLPTGPAFIHAFTNTRGALVVGGYAFGTAPPDHTVTSALAVVSSFFDASAGNLVLPPAISYDAFDDQPPFTPGTAGAPVEMSRLTGFDGTNWDRIRALADNADAQAAAGVGALLTLARPQGWNGAAFDRLRTASAANLSAASGIGAQLAVGPGEWAVVNEGAAGVRATVTRAAVAGTRHVCRSIAVSVGAVNAQGILFARLRDGASGAGAILWSRAFVLAAGTSAGAEVSGLNIVGSVNTAMTLEFDVAPAAGNFQVVAMSGYDVT